MALGGGLFASQTARRASTLAPWQTAATISFRRLSIVNDHLLTVQLRRGAMRNLRGVATQASGHGPNGMERGLVSCEWLHAQLTTNGKESIRVVDASWYLPNSPFAAPVGSGGAHADFLAGPRLCGSVFFDIDAVASLHPQGLPHMLPCAHVFAEAMHRAGIDRSTRVVVYDRFGLFSAPRFWYTLKVFFNHPAEVAVLDGGLPRWKALGFPLEEGAENVYLPPVAGTPDAWEASPPAVWNIEKVRDNIEKQEALLIDARASGRFSGEVPEPREGMRGGHVPRSVNVPFMDLVSGKPPPAEETMKMRPPAELRQRFRDAGINIEEMATDASMEISGPAVVTSCGSGMTACILGLAMHQIGLPTSRWALYDGSWTEWGGRADTPIIRRAADGGEEQVP
eukprot:TRINITY_DN56579_c0_g1_i1.p1 TRINITY_DN56579_c0_g1~~TRINITY_DN56579_c0_g1_i1.p1  ORF type:complete len:443 (+),score=61.73 TRINITY_DN56579_c0_g1_i1:139-1329(+)